MSRILLLGDSILSLLSMALHFSVTGCTDAMVCCSHLRVYGRIISTRAQLLKFSQIRECSATELELPVTICTSPRKRQTSVLLSKRSHQNASLSGPSLPRITTLHRSAASFRREMGNGKSFKICFQLKRACISFVRHASSYFSRSGHFVDSEASANFQESILRE